MQSAKDVHEGHIGKAMEKHQLAIHSYKHRKVNTLTRGEAVPKIALYARDQQVDGANDNEIRKKLQSLEKSNKKLEKLIMRATFSSNSTVKASFSLIASRILSFNTVACS